MPARPGAVIRSLEPSSAIETRSWPTAAIVPRPCAIAEPTPALVSLAIVAQRRSDVGRCPFAPADRAIPPALATANVTTSAVRIFVFIGSSSVAGDVLEVHRVGGRAEV